MNKLPLPDYDDFQALLAVAHNTKLGSHPHLIPALGDIEIGYLLYLWAEGNAVDVYPVRLSAAQQGYLRGHFSDPPNALKHLTEMRDDRETFVCAMCGSMHSGTLDHVLPQDTYPEFSIFSPNLVPACKCNSKRGNTLFGPNPGERVLHPYFDECLSHRLVTAHFNNLGPVPTISIRLQVPLAHRASTAALSFHFKTIVERSGIVKHLRRKWASMYRKPRLVARDLGRPVATMAQLRDILTQERDDLDDDLVSRNNWDSVFISGLLEAHVLDWLFQKLTAPGRAPNAPLGAAI